MLAELLLSDARDETSLDLDIPQRPPFEFNFPDAYNIPSAEGVYSIYLALSPLDAPPLQYTPFFDILSWLLSAPLFAMAILRPL